MGVASKRKKPALHLLFVSWAILEHAQLTQDELRGM